MKIVINCCYGGFSLSEEAYNFLGIEWDGNGYAYSDDEKRTAPELIECVETLGDKSFGWLAKLKVIEIPDDVDYEIEEYDGAEWVSEKHRKWE